MKFKEGDTVLIKRNLGSRKRSLPNGVFGIIYSTRFFKIGQDKSYIVEIDKIRYHYFETDLKSIKSTKLTKLIFSKLLGEE